MTAPAALPVVDVSLDETIRLMKRELALTFPGVTFSIRRSRGTGYGWVWVAWTDGPTVSQVRAVTDAYEGARFDGMTDSEHPVEHTSARGDGTVVRLRYGTRGINTERAISDAFRADVTRRVLRHCGDATLPDAQRAAWLAMDDVALLCATANVRIWNDWMSSLLHRALSAPADFPFLWAPA